MTWKKEGKTFWIVYEDTDELNKDFPLNSGNVLSSNKTVWKLETMEGTSNVAQTKASFCSKSDIKGVVPTKMMKSQVLMFAKNMFSAAFVL